MRLGTITILAFVSQKLRNCDTLAGSVAADDIGKRLHGTEKRNVRRVAPKIYSRKLVELIFELHYCRIHNLIDAKFAERQAASRHLKQFTAVDVLEEQAVGREKQWRHSISN